jgi:S-adenosylmethionine hydrolase
VTSVFQPTGLVTLTSDFGLRDAYLGEMKGVMLGIAPGLGLCDLSHQIGAQDIAHGARVLRLACPRFPVGTVHLAVVDPGVGMRRRAIVAVARGHALVAPDNGLLDPVLGELGGQVEVYGIPDHAWLPAVRSATFHGRDLFAPTAAALAAGLLTPDRLGPPLPWSPKPASRPHREGDGLWVNIVHIDRFGNLITDATEDDLAVWGASDQRLGRRLRIVLGDGRDVPFVSTYGEAAPGELVALIGSHRELEVARVNGSAAETTGLRTGDPLLLVASRAGP